MKPRSDKTIKRLANEFIMRLSTVWSARQHSACAYWSDVSLVVDRLKDGLLVAHLYILNGRGLPTAHTEKSVPDIYKSAPAIRDALGRLAAKPWEAWRT